MDKRTISAAKKILKYFKEQELDDEAQAIQSLIAHAEKAPVKWPEEKVEKPTLSAYPYDDASFNAGYNQGRADTIAAYQEAAKGEKNG